MICKPLPEFILSELMGRRAHYIIYIHRPFHVDTP